MPRLTDLDRLRSDLARVNHDLAGWLPEPVRRELEGWREKLLREIEEKKRDESSHNRVR